MKKIIFATAVLLFSMNIKAQNVNTKTETTTTISSKKDENGIQKTVKSAVVKEVQNIELESANPNSINIAIKDSPVVTTTMTTITNPDGSTRTTSIDRSGNYQYQGTIFKLALDPAGYLMSSNKSKTGILRKTSTNSYIFKSKNNAAIGYFDTNGNLNLEIYDDKTDKITNEKYEMVK